jgi:hypothetical protein
LLIPALAAAAAAGRAACAGLAPPLFTAWVGRIARLQAGFGAARLFLGQDGTGSVEVKALFFCRSTPVLDWRIGEDGRRLDYRRRSFADPARLVAGQVRIAPDSGLLHLLETRDDVAEFEGFEQPGAGGRC